MRFFRRSWTSIAILLTCIFFSFAGSAFSADSTKITISTDPSQLNPDKNITGESSLIQYQVYPPQSGLTEQFVSPESSNAIIITGDYLEYIASDKIIKGKGNVKIEQMSKILNADEVKFNIDTNELEATGNVYLKEGETIFKGEKINYNTKKSTGTFLNSKIYNKPWYFKTPKFKKDQKNSFEADNNIIMTTCDKEYPHYNFTAKKMIVYIDDKVLAFNVFFYVGNVPVLYSPYYYFLLKYSPFYFKPGYSTKYGWWYNSKLHYTAPPYSYGSFILDFWQRRGYARGLEYNYFVDDKRKGTMYFYDIDQKPVWYDTTRGRFYNPAGEDTIDRWKSQVYFTHELYPNFFAKLNYDRLSDPDFLFDYEDIQGKRTTENINFTLLKTSDTHNISLFFQELKSWKPNKNNKNEFLIDNKATPEMKIDFARKPIIEILEQPIYYKLDLLYANRFQKYYENTYLNIKADDYYYRSFNISQALMTSFYPFQRTSLSPTIKYDQNWYSDHNPVNLNDRNFGVYGTQLKLVTNITRNIRNELTHDYSKQLDELDGTEYFLYKGLIKNKLNNIIYLENTKQSTGISVESNYELRKSIYETTYRDYRSRFSDLKTSIYVKKDDNIKIISNLYWDIYLDEYDSYTPEYQKWHRKKFKLNDTSIEFTEKIGKEASFNLNSKYYKVYIDGIGPEPAKISSFASIGGTLQLKLTKNWSVIYRDSFKNAEITNKFHIRDFERERQDIELIRDLHCWEAIFSVRQRLSPYDNILVKEFWFNISLKALPGQKFEFKEPSLSPYSTYYNF